MYVYELMKPEDIFSLDIPNLDINTENFTLDYYIDYLLAFPDYFITIREFHPRFVNQWVVDGLSSLCDVPVLGYIFGKVETNNMLHIHISGITISPDIRGKNFGTNLLNFFHANGNAINAFFCDLFVRESNVKAIKFYHKNGYAVYRKIIGYYVFPHEDAAEMRKPLLKDKNKISLLNGKDINSLLL